VLRYRRAEKRPDSKQANPTSCVATSFRAFHGWASSAELVSNVLLSLVGGKIKNPAQIDLSREYGFRRQIGTGKESQKTRPPLGIGGSFAGCQIERVWSVDWRVSPAATARSACKEQIWMNPHDR